MIEIPLTQNKVAIISDTDAELVDGLSLFAVRHSGNLWYAAATVDKKMVYLHVFLMRPPAGMEVDHRDGNGLNCVRDNMRIASHAQNGRNRKISKNNKTGYKGVRRYQNNPNLFKVYIKSDYKTITLRGTYPTAESAARAYDEKAKELFGEFARLNFPA